MHSPAPLRRPPERTDTPLPGSFFLDAGPATSRADDGAVVLGGSPLRLLRLSDAARRLVAQWEAGAPIGRERRAGLLARRLASSGAFVARPGRPSFAPRNVTVVVPVRGRPAQLDRLLDALRDLATVVVDDASPDASATKEIAARHGAAFVGLTRQAGPAGARNAGLGAVGTPLVAFVDSDCVAPPGWLDPLLGHFDDPLVAAVAPRIVPAATSGPRWLAAYEAVHSSLDRGPTEALVRPRSPVPYVPAAALVVRRDVVEGAELFDPALLGGEDVDLVWRLVEGGWDVRYAPSSSVAHDGPSSLGAFVSRRAFYGTTAAPLAERHPDALAPLQTSAWSAAVWTLLAGRRPVSALAVLAASIGILARRLTGLVRHPVTLAARIAGGGTLRSARPALSGLARAWSPLLTLGLVPRRTRRGAALALILPALADWVQASGDLDPFRYSALHVLDNLSYGTGVWVGCARTRTLGPLLPRLEWRARVWSSGALADSLQDRSP